MRAGCIQDAYGMHTGCNRDAIEMSARYAIEMHSNCTARVLQHPPIYLPIYLPIRVLPNLTTHTPSVPPYIYVYSYGMLLLSASLLNACTPTRAPMRLHLAPQS